MHLSTYIVDAFSDGPFTGNPAAVVPLDAWLPDELMRSIAAQNALSETAFVGPAADVVPLVAAAAAADADPTAVDHGLRWFTPGGEVDLCGHATMAAGHVAFHHRLHAGGTVRFLTRAGRLAVRLASGRRLAIDLPARPPRPVEPPAGLAEALGAEPVEVHAARDLLVVLDAPQRVRDLAPDLARLAALDVFAVVVTAAGDPGPSPDAAESGEADRPAPTPADFVSRFFAPGEGVPEDPVTGSAHCSLVPFWADRLGREALLARQLSARGGRLACRRDGDRVHLEGGARTYLEGMVTVPGPPAADRGDDARAARRRARTDRAVRHARGDADERLRAHAEQAAVDS